MEEVVTVAGLSKHYGEVTALRDLDLSIGKGEVFGLIGPNGAGKTTFVRSITGTIAPTTGDVQVLGAPPQQTDRSRIGLLPQAFDPPARLTGRELIRYYAGLYPDARPAESVLEDVGMAQDADRWYEQLSGGQQRRICVGTALVNDPDLLILDEPTMGIDPRGRRRLWDLLSGLRKAGTSIVLTTHDMEEAEQLGDRVGLLADGELVAVGPPKELVETHAGQSRLIVEPTSPVEATTIDEIDLPVDHHDDMLAFENIAPTDVPAVIDALNQAGISYSRFTWEEPSLEDVFLSLTPEALPS